MAQSLEDDSDTKKTHSGGAGAKMPWILAVCFLVAGCFLFRHFFFGSSAMPEIRVGNSVIRVPCPENARLKPEDGTDTGLSFTIGDMSKNENVGYFFSNTDTEPYTTGKFSELLAEARKRYSSMGGLLRTEYIKQTVLQLADVPLKQVEARQHEENNSLVMTVKGNMNHYGVLKHMNCAQLLFLLRDRPYVMTIIIVSSSGSHRDALKEAWKWHDAIAAANANSP